MEILLNTDDILKQICIYLNMDSIISLSKCNHVLQVFYYNNIRAITYYKILLYITLSLDDLNVRQLKNLCKFYELKRKPFVSVNNCEKSTILTNNGSIFYYDTKNNVIGKKYNINNIVNMDTTGDYIIDNDRIIYYNDHHNDKYMKLYFGSDENNIEACVLGTRGPRHILKLRNDGTIQHDKYVYHDIINVKTNASRGILLRKDGKVYSFGFNHGGELGLGSYEQKATKIPTLIPNIDNIIGISVGDSHTLLLRSDGRVYSFGHCPHGSLGLGKNMTKMSIPMLIPDINNIVSISAGRNHSLLLRSDGKVYSFGCDQFYEFKGLTRNFTPRIINPDNNDMITSFLRYCKLIDNNINNIIGIYAGDNCSYLLNSNGEICVFNRYNMGKMITNINIFKD
jgi:hypothetical protein